MPRIVTLAENPVRWFRWDVVILHTDAGRMSPAPIQIKRNPYAGRQEYFETKILAAKRYAVQHNLMFDPSWAVTYSERDVQYIEQLSEQLDQELYNEGREVFILGGDPAGLWHPMQQKGYQDGLDDMEAMIQEQEAKPWL